MVGSHRFRRGLIAVLVAVAVLNAGAAVPAVAAPSADARSQVVDLDRLVDRYNENLDRLPKPARRVLANERIAVRVEMAEGDTRAYYFGTGKKSSIERHDRDGFENGPTVRIRTDAATVRELNETAEDDWRKAAIEAGTSDDVHMEGVGTANKMKIAFLKSALEAMSHVS